MVGIRVFLFSALVLAHAASVDPAAMERKEWRLDDVATLRDNGERGEVVLNGTWVAEGKNGLKRVPVPGLRSHMGLSPEPECLVHLESLRNYLYSKMKAGSR